MTAAAEAIIKGPRQLREKRRRNARPKAQPMMSGLFLAIVCVAMLAPFIWTLLSVTKPTDVAFANPPVLAYEPTAQAFVDLWQTTNFYQYLINTGIVAVGSTIVALVIGLPAAYALARAPGYVSAILLILALVFRSLPRFAVVLPMYELSRQLGIHDTTFALGAALVAINQPFSIWLLRNFFVKLPEQIDEAAMIDGCSRFQALRRVIIPMMGPGILTAGVFMFLFAFQEYLTPLILTDTKAQTVPLFIATQLGQTLPMLQQAGAAAILLTGLVVLFAFIAQKYLVAGLSDGAGK
ncbi:carbohydrate ABC transporter permease [Zhihengliuella salsuginis]|uniref:ABC transporter permease protein y4oR n=1 Tax=Zhihengliuella salsuginis TaxID=578222 RepID=A0ABQ3GC68_9MICC|nr:carbohydrate ABC transporter permease [Zhihengliuella salsuginis]GHD00072.1 putative ABC transporter permease protein y4oR [Zhihengliuella salsuginis]